MQKGLRFWDAAWPNLEVLPSLLEVSLEGCQFSGPLPSAWGGLTSLTFLDVSGNSLGGNGAAALPAAWGGMAALQELRVGKLGLTGDALAPLAAAAYMPGLMKLKAADNQLTGLPAGARGCAACRLLLGARTAAQPASH